MTKKTTVRPYLVLVPLVLGCLAQVRSARADEALRAGDNVAICGDSITEQKLYSVFIEDYLLMCQPVARLEAHQFGWSGETSWGFRDRMKNEVLAFKPSVATTCYGMNDGAYSLTDPARVTQYKQATEAIVKTFKDGGVRFIVLGSPGAVDTDTFDKKANKKVLAVDYNKTLADLGGVVKQIAAEQGVTYADLHTPMLDVMAKAKAKFGNDYHVAGGDGIHPSANGHLIMAYAFLKALGCKGDIGTISLDMKTNKAEATEGQKILSVNNGAVSVEATRYPFCFYGAPASPNSTRGVLEFLPFNEELNRYRLVVRNAPTARLKVTWGKDSKEFSAAELGTGINLAAEFLDNPFAEAFTAVETTIKQQQNFETPAVKGILHSLPGWKTLLPDESSTFDALTLAVTNRAKKLAQASSAAVVPVQHLIKVEAMP